MKERPILFSAAMVKAILEGRKTQTRRVLKTQPLFSNVRLGSPTLEERRQLETQWLIEHRCPYGQSGDRLWIRETGNISTTKDAFMYADTGGILAPSAPEGSASWAREWKTCPSIHMPRWASRVTLEIVGVRVERVGDITEPDAVAEGIPAFISSPSKIPVMQFATL
jgi:hypothetical protein